MKIISKIILKKNFENYFERNTTGQERFQTITYNSYNGAQGIFILYNITDREQRNFKYCKKVEVK